MDQNNGGFNNGQQTPPNGGGYYPQYNTYFDGRPRPPKDTGLMVLSILNIVLGCCGISMILGIIALVFVIQAPNANTYEETLSKNNTAKILNIVGLVFLVLSTAASIFLMNAYMELLETIISSGAV